MFPTSEMARKIEGWSKFQCYQWIRGKSKIMGTPCELAKMTFFSLGTP